MSFMECRQPLIVVIGSTFFISQEAKWFAFTRHAAMST